jgi:hypothetical protein
VRIIASALVGLCLAGAAAAQNADAPMVFIPTWDAEPGPVELVRHYPAEALQQNVSGIAILCCMPREDGSVDCAVSSEWPTEQGFGHASVEASVGYRLSQQSRTDLAHRPGTPLRISMLWAAPIIMQPTIDNLRRIDGETMYACMPPE